MINIKTTSDKSAVIIVTDNGSLILPLSVIHITISNNSDLITFINKNTDRIIINELIDKITIDGNPTSKDAIISDFGAISK